MSITYLEPKKYNNKNSNIQQESGAELTKEQSNGQMLN